MSKLHLYFSILSLFIATSCFAHEYHVSKKGDDNNDGSAQKPFKTIAAAVDKAYAGDTITVHGGTYREYINPIRGGESDLKRIVYRAAPNEKVEIKGSEVITGWKKEKNGVWKVVIPNQFFGDYNPYKDSIYGDWFLNKERIHHTGEVFLNGKSLYEMETIDKVFNPVALKNIKDSVGSVYTWYCQSDEKNTTIWANFQKADPNKQLVEITTRKTVFYPLQPGINYITISGFHISQAATQWAAPTAEQVGMVATHWNKGWIIENNVISDSKCSGITLGKDRSTGHNVWSADKANVNRDGNIHYIEVVFNVMRNNWNKETIGSHIVRNNQIFNCEQAGISGSMGAIFSTIENNHIYNIFTKRQFYGFEIGGIKFHAPIDVTIKGNNIHDNYRGIWLDWMTQGTRVTRNLLYNNDREDLFIEVNHGPYLVDNNISLSPVSLTNQSGGGAYVHNIFGGRIGAGKDMSRFTPYFLPHSTDMAGLTTIYGGDDRFYNNIFIGNGNQTESKHGLASYNDLLLPVWLKGNVYYHGAKASTKDVDAISFTDYHPDVKLLEKREGTFLHLTLNEQFFKHQVQTISSETLGKAKIPKAAFDNPDGSSITIDTDYFGNKRTEKSNYAGPFSAVKSDRLILKVW